MPSFNADRVLFVISLLLLTASFLYTVALVIPSLGKRMYGKLWPRAFIERSQRRAAYLRAIAFIGSLFFIGLHFFLGQIKNRVCEAQETVALVSFLLPLLAVVCTSIVSIAQKRTGIDQISVSKATKKSKLTTAIAYAIVIGSLLLAFFAIRNSTNQTFEPIER